MPAFVSAWAAAAALQLGAPAAACAEAVPTRAACLAERQAELLSRADAVLPRLLPALREAEKRRASKDLTGDALGVHALAETDIAAHCRLAAALSDDAAAGAACGARLAEARLAQIEADSLTAAACPNAPVTASWPLPPGKAGDRCGTETAVPARLSCLVRQRDEERARLQGAYDALDAIGAPRQAVEDARLAYFRYSEAECRLLRDIADASSAPEKALIALPCEAQAAAARTEALRTLRRERPVTGRAGGREDP